MSSALAATRTAQPAPPSDRHRFRYDIEGLRATAVVLVALNHANLPHLGGGFVGVDIFFVISGFLITGLLLGEAEKHGRISLGDFYARRVRRILPMGALVTIVTMVATYDLAGTAIGNRTAVDAGWAAIFLANVHFAASGVDYFNRGTTPSPLQHFWSLGVEEQFYVLWPLLIILVGALVVGLRSRRRVTIVVIAVGCLASLAWSVHQTSTAPTAAYFSPFTRAFELGIGALLATAIRSRKLLLTHAAGNVIAVVGALMVIVSVVTFDESTPFPGYAALLPTVGVAMVVLGGTDSPDGPVGRVLGIAPMRFVGQRSYGFYLWHFPWLVLPTAALGHAPALHLELLLVLAAFVTSCITYSLIEDPVRQSGFLKDSRPLVSLGLGVVLIVGVLGTSQFLQRLHQVSYTQESAQVTSTLPTSEEVIADVATSTSLTRAPADLEPPADAVAEFGSLTPEEGLCDRPYDVTEATDCFLGDTTSDQTIAVWGDSHASMWAPALAAIASQTDKRLAVYAKYGCAPLLDVTPWHPTEDRPYTECSSFKDSVVPKLLALKPETVVLTGAFRGWAYSQDGQRVAGGEFTSDNEWIPTDTIDGVWDTALAKTITALVASGTRVVVLGDSAYPTQDGGQCLAVNADDLAACTTPRSAGTFEAHNTAEQQTAESLGATYVPVTRWFCTDTACPPVVGTTAVYRDAYHMTRQYSLLLTRAMGEAAGLLDPAADAGADASEGAGTPTGSPAVTPAVSPAASPAESPAG